MATTYQVTGSCAVVRLTGAPEIYLEHGALLPTAAEPGHVRHLLEVGLIAKVKPAAETPAPAVKPEDELSDDLAPSDPDGLPKLNLDQLRALAAEREIDLGGATRKDDIIAVLKAGQVK